MCQVLISINALYVSFHPLRSPLEWHPGYHVKLRELLCKELPTTKGRGTENWPSEIREDKRYPTAFIPSPCLKGWLDPCISRSTRRKVPRGKKEERAPFLRQLTQNPEPTNPQIQPHQDHMALQEYSDSEEEGRAGRNSPHTDNPGKRPKTSHFPIPVSTPLL